MQLLLKRNMTDVQQCTAVANGFGAVKEESQIKLKLQEEI